MHAAFEIDLLLVLLVKLSQFMCLGRITSVLYQVGVPSLRV